LANDPKQFYDGLAADYDAMVGFDQRVAAASRFAADVAGRGPVRRAIDTGCGTGAYAIALAGRGIETTGMDISPGMLAKARENAERADVSVTWITAPLQQFSRHVASPVDLVLCLGNTLPHVLTEADADFVFAEFSRALAPGGRLVVQLLNYERILARQERVVSVDRSGDVEHVRFYDFLLGGERVRFNILTLHWHAGACRHEMRSVELRPYTRADVADRLAAHGFVGIEAYGGLDFSAFDPAESETLMLVGRR